MIIKNTFSRSYSMAELRPHGAVEAGEEAGWAREAGLADAGLMQLVASWRHEHFLENPHQPWGCIYCQISNIKHIMSTETMKFGNSGGLVGGGGGSSRMVLQCLNIIGSRTLTMTPGPPPLCWREPWTYSVAKFPKKVDLFRQESRKHSTTTNTSMCCRITKSKYMIYKQFVRPSGPHI